jgi:hypothetical protein
VNFRRKQRDWNTIAADPQTPYMVGRLLGANEMAVVLLQLEQNATARHVAEVLERVAGYFMEDVPLRKPLALSEADTLHG